LRPCGSAAKRYGGCERFRSRGARRVCLESGGCGSGGDGGGGGWEWGRQRRTLKRKEWRRCGGLNRCGSRR